MSLKETKIKHKFLTLMQLLRPLLQNRRRPLLLLRQLPNTLQQQNLQLLQNIRLQQSITQRNQKSLKFHMPQNRQMEKISIPNSIPLMELAGKTRDTHKPIHMEQAMEMLKTITKMDFR